MSTVVPGTGHAQQNNMGFYSKAELALYPRTVTAAPGTGTELDGAAVNRCDPSVSLSAKVAIPAHIVMASGHSVVVSRGIDSRDDSDDSWHPYGDDPADLTITANNDGSAVDTDLGFDVDLSGAKAEIRLRLTPDFSASGVDTMAVGSSFVFGGFDHNPAA